MAITHDELLRGLEGVKKSGDGWAAKCPVHEDRIASLSVGIGDEGRLLLYCFAGCSPEAILAALGYKFSDIMPARREPSEPIYYNYRDEKGRTLFQVVRSVGPDGKKKFLQRRPDGRGDWVWHLDCDRPDRCTEKGHQPLSPAVVPRVLYRLPELLALPKSAVVYIVEGEKDADCLWSLGYPATTNPGGAGKWPEEFSRFFEGRDVAVLPDNDKVGREHARAIARSLTLYRANAAHVISLPGLAEKGDVSDWFGQPGNTREKFDAIVYEEFHIAEAERDALAEEVAIEDAEARDRKWWSLADLVTTKAIREPEGFLHGEMFCRGRISSIFGPGGSGKSYLVMYMGAQIALGRPVHTMRTRPGRVLFLSEEMGGPENKFRTRQVFDEQTIAKLSPDQFGIRWHSGFDFWGNGKTLMENKSVNDFIRICDRESNRPDIVFLDSLSRIHHAKENDNSEMGAVMANLEMAARMASVALVFVHHAGKASEFREGSERMRGASVVRDYCQDVISVHCLSRGEKKSLVTIEKAQSLAGGKETHPFIFTQEIDSSGRVVVKSDGTVEKGVVFVTALYDEKALRDTTAEKDAAVVFNTVRTLIDQKDERVTAEGKIERKDLISAIANSLHWKPGKVDRAIKRNILSGSLLREQTAKDSVLISLSPEGEN